MTPADEHKLYQSDKVSWVLVLMYRHLPAERFRDTLDAVRREATEEQKQAARQEWKKWA